MPMIRKPKRVGTPEEIAALGQRIEDDARSAAVAWALREYERSRDALLHVGRGIDLESADDATLQQARDRGKSLAQRMVSCSDFVQTFGDDVARRTLDEISRGSRD